MAASGHRDQMKEDQTAARSSSQNMLLISFVTQERHAETFQPSNVAIKSVSGCHEDELPAASQHRAVCICVALDPAEAPKHTTALV